MSCWKSVTTKRTCSEPGVRCTLPSFTMPPSWKRLPGSTAPCATSVGGMYPMLYFIENSARATATPTPARMPTTM
jgi:hypothetical protein